MFALILVWSLRCLWFKVYSNWELILALILVWSLKQSNLLNALVHWSITHQNVVELAEYVSGAQYEGDGALDWTIIEQCWWGWRNRPVDFCWWWNLLCIMVRCFGSVRPEIRSGEDGWMRVQLCRRWRFALDCWWRSWCAFFSKTLTLSPELLVDVSWCWLFPQLWWIRMGDGLSSGWLLCGWGDLSGVCKPFHLA